MVERGGTLTAQNAVLGSMLIESKLIGEVLGKARDEDFIEPKCRMVFQAIRGLFNAGEPVDPVTVRDKLGGPTDGEWGRYLMELMVETPTAQNIWEYIRIMQEQARLARLNELGALLQVTNNLDSAQGYIAQANGLFSERQGVQRMNMEQMLLDFYERHTKEHEYLTWGFDKLNDQLFAERGDMVVVGGYPSAGKTALAIAFGWHLARTYRVGFYSLETTHYKLADRLISNLAKIELKTIKRGQLEAADWEIISLRSPEIVGRKMELIRAGGMTVQDIQSDALANRYDIIFVDYLQLVVSKGYNTTEEVTHISLGLHQLAQRNNITVVALSQLSRPEKKGTDEVNPTMSSLRGSGQIEQDADIVMLLYKEEPGKQNSRRVLRVAKNKEGEQGMIYLTFDGAIQTFRESALDAPIPAKRREPEYKQVKFTELDDPFLNKKEA